MRSLSSCWLFPLVVRISAKPVATSPPGWKGPSWFCGWLGVPSPAVKTGDAPPRQVFPGRSAYRSRLPLAKGRAHPRRVPPGSRQPCSGVKARGTSVPLCFSQRLGCHSTRSSSWDSVAVREPPALGASLGSPSFPPRRPWGRGRQGASVASGSPLNKCWGWISRVQPQRRRDPKSCHGGEVCCS